MKDYKIITFTGAQSTGKTTLFEHLQQANPNFEFAPEITRSLADKGYPINEDGGFETQLLILNTHLNNIYNSCKQEARVLDRCILDGYIYTKYLAQHTYYDLEVRKKLESLVALYENIINRDFLSKYAAIFYTSHIDVKLEYDGVRSSSKYFRNKIIAMFADHFAVKDKIVYELVGSVDQRLQIIKRVCDEKGIKIAI